MILQLQKDSRSPKRAHGLAHRSGDSIHHPLRGLEAATGGDLGEAGGRAGESCAAEHGRHAGGHFCVCVNVCVCGRIGLEGVVVGEWIVVRLFAAMLGSGRVRVETGCSMELGWWSAPGCDGGPEA